ncbi:GMC oxidoreductase [Apiospora arundinis]
MLWDYIIVGGGLSGSVVSNRLLQQDSSLKILLIEAGPNANDQNLWPNATNTMGGTYDWDLTSIPQVHVDNRPITLAQGKALGGGTLINMGLWTRGDRSEYDIWGETVGDKRWSYDGLLPYMKKTESYWNQSINAQQHGYEGKVHLQTPTSTNRTYPLRQKVLESWEQIGVSALPSLDANAGDITGVAEFSECRDKGRRQTASAVYSLDGITVLTNTIVAKVLITGPEGSPSASGIQLDNGTSILGKEVILATGAVHTPQLLMLSGIGPEAELSKHSIPVKKDLADVGKNYADHILSPSAWKVKNPDQGWALGSSNPVFKSAANALGSPSDFVVTTSIKGEGLAKAIEADEGKAPSPDHPLLRNGAFFEHIMLYTGSTNGSRVSFSGISLSPTSRGSITLASANIHDSPVIDPKYLATAVDRYVYREGIRQEVAIAGGADTVLGREILDGEAQPQGVSEPYTTESTDEYIDSRVRASARSVHHPMGTAAMGKVVDTNLRVKGVCGLRVVDASVLPVVIPAHLMVAVYAMAEQAAEIILQDQKQCTKCIPAPGKGKNGTAIAK